MVEGDGRRVVYLHLCSSVYESCIAVWDGRRLPMKLAALGVVWWGVRCWIEFTEDDFLLNCNFQGLQGVIPVSGDTGKGDSLLDWPCWGAGGLWCWFGGRPGSGPQKGPELCIDLMELCPFLH